MKRKISLLMAFIMVCNVLTVLAPFSGAVRLQAATFGVTSSFRSTLKDGISDSVPFEDTSSIPENDVMIKFPLVNQNDVSSTTGTYRLQYPIDDNRFVHFTIVKNDTSATVTYQDFAGTSGAESASYFGYQVYSVVERKYYDYNVYPNVNSAQQPNYQVNTTSPTPTFTIERGKGFSFKVNGYNIRFLWNRDSDTISYVTDRVLPGRLMDFELLYNDGITPIPQTPALPAGVTAYGKTQVVNGISTAGADFKVTPTSEQVVGPTRHDIDYVFDMTGTIVETPGKPDNEIKIELSLPKKWNGTSFASTVAAGDIANLGLQMSLINTENPADIRSVLFTDIFGSIDLTNDYSGSVTASYAAGKVTIVVGGLRSSLLFDDSSFEIGSTTAADGVFTSKKTRLSTDAIYTFMAYQIFYVNGKFNLSVKPYENHTGFYMLKVSENGGMSYYDANTVPSTGQGDILFPLTITVSGGDTQFYQVAFSKGKPFSVDNTGIKSQKSKFKSDPSKLGINLPTQFEVFDVKMSPIKGTVSTNESMAVTYKLRWNIASYNALKAILDATDPVEANRRLALTYNIKDILSPIEANAQRVFASLEVVFYYDAGNIVADFYEIDATGNEILTGNVIKAAYGMRILDRPYAVSGEDPDVATIKGYVEIETVGYNKDNAVVINNNEYRYPNIYFLSIQHVTIQKGSGAAVVISPVAESLYDSLTLNAVTGLEVPTAQNVGADNAVMQETAGVLTRSSFDAHYTIPMNKIKEFIDNNLPYDNYELTYNLYITQDENKLKNLAAVDDYAARTAAAVETPFVPSILTDGAIYFSDINGHSAIQTVDNKAAIDELRAGKIVRIADILPGDFATNADLQTFIKSGVGENYKYTLDGLDKNQRYYFALDVSIKFEDVAPNPVYEEWKHSGTSTLAGITTMGDMVVPSPEDKTPPAPVLNKENVGLSYVTIFWNKIVDIINPDNPVDFGKLEYEIIRLTDTQMDNAVLEQKSDFATVFNNKLPNTEKLGFRSDGADIMEYVSNSFSVVSQSDTRYVYTPNDVVKFTDNTLKPNTIYFYYVRTVRIIGGKELYSSWSAISATTDPVKSPINLKIVREGVSYDPKTEIVISFDAPIAALSMLGSDFDLQYSVKKDNEEWGDAITMSASVLSRSASPLKIDGLDYYHFVYTVRDLKHGTNYAFRVRMADNVYGDYSMYSNIAESRTALDQEEYEKEKITDDWLEYLKDRLQELFKNDYWVADDSSSYMAIYRPTMFDGVMLKTIDSQIELVRSDADTLIYLIPQSALLSANAQNKGFKIVHGDMEIIVSPNAINTNDNEAVLDAIQRMKDKKAVDYYVRVTLDWYKLSSSALVDGRQPSTPQLDVRLEIVTATKNSKTWDNEIMNMVLDAMTDSDNFDRAADNIKDMLEDNASSEEIIRYIDRYINNLLPGISDDIYDSFEDQIDLSYDVTYFDAPVIIKYNGAGADETVKGYQKENGVWISKALTPLGSSQAIYTRTQGLFIFCKYKAYYNGLTQIPGSEGLAAIITKYGLDDYLGRGDSFNINAPLTANMVTGVVARLAGAGTTANAADFLRSKGYIVPTRTSTATITLQETIYYTMALYEIKTNTKISTVKIRNFAATADIAGIRSEFLKSIQVANELGIYTANKAMAPNSTPTVKDLLQMIVQLDKKVKL